MLNFIHCVLHLLVFIFSFVCILYQEMVVKLVFIFVLHFKNSIFYVMVGIFIFFLFCILSGFLDAPRRCWSFYFVLKTLYFLWFVCIWLVFFVFCQDFEMHGEVGCKSFGKICFEDVHRPQYVGNATF